MTADRRSHVPEIKRALVNPQRVLEALGVFGEGKTRRRQGSDGWVLCCPMHADRSPSLSVQIVGGELVWRCHGGCGVGGDVLSLIAGVRGLDMRRDFPTVLLEAAKLGGLWHVVDELEGRQSVAPIPRPAPTLTAAAPEPPRTYPDGVENFWARLEPISEDPDVAAYLAGRAIDPDRVEAADLARVIPVGVDLPTWARCRRGSWWDAGYRLVVPMYDCLGVMRSVRGWRVGGDPEMPKRLPPSGHKASELVMGDAFAVAMLRGTRHPEIVAICEGESDFLSQCVVTQNPRVAIMGVISGAWTFGFTMRFPVGGKVAILTDNDEAGDRYAKEIFESLSRRCFVTRSTKVEA